MTAAADRFANTEAVLAGIWGEVLRVADVAPTDDFIERGGDSLQATQVIWRVADRFSVQLPLTWFFRYPTLRDLARHVETHLDHD
jgi:acyl carrier protein